MNEAWDSATHRSDCYVSCMKINGVPLLPPVLTKECRKEMQYYKILALEVEKRIKFLKRFVKDSDSNVAITKDEPKGISDFEKILKAESDIPEKEKENHFVDNNLKDNDGEFPNGYESIRSDVTVIDNNDTGYSLNSPKLVIDINMSISDMFKDTSKTINNVCEEDNNKPERDYNCILNKPATVDLVELPIDLNPVQKEDGNLNLISKNNNEMDSIQTKNIAFNDSAKENISPNIESNFVVEDDLRMVDIPSSIAKAEVAQPKGPSSLGSSKSFDNIHAELSSPPKLVRQRSYTILKPSAVLIAHLEVESLNSGVEMSSISMSESCSNLSWQVKKRRSWDLETAKVKWSSMATELNSVPKVSPQKRTHIARPSVKSPINQKSHFRTRSTTTQDRFRRSSVPTTRAINTLLNSNATSKSSISKTAPPPVTNKSQCVIPTKRTVEAKTESPKNAQISVSVATRNNEKSPNRDFTAKLSMITSNKSPSTPSSPSKTSDNSTPVTPVKDDPSTCIRELYEKIQNQQFLRMASLIEKQKKEQLLLQQVFEEQNSLFYKQLKTICPKSPNEIKEAWSEKSTSKEHPVSLSQLISSSPKASKGTNSTLTLNTTLNDTKHYINKTEEVLKKSRNVLNNLKSNQKSKPSTTNQAIHSRSMVSTSPVRPKSVSSSIPRRDENLIRSVTESPTRSPRKSLNSDSSQYSNVEPMLTDRTNDTMADLNFTLTSDDGNPDLYPEALSKEHNATYVKSVGKTDQSIPRLKGAQSPKMRGKLGRSGSVDSNIDGSHASYTLQSSKNSTHSDRKSVRKLFADRQASDKELKAASTIVAYAKGYLVRRLLRTERVQATVQTIRDALVCALQLHQDREGIRGADIDLHRRLIQQITAACYALNDTFIVSSPKERCTLIAQDRERQKLLTVKQMSASSSYQTPRQLSSATKKLPKKKPDVMSHSHSGVFGGRPTRTHAHPPGAMTQSNHEMYSSEDKYRHNSKKYLTATDDLHKRQPWR